MKKTNDDVIYLSRAEWEAFKQQEAEERMELVRRVERGELTAREANQEAALVKEPHKGKLINLREHLEAMTELFPVDYLAAERKGNGRRRKKTVRAA